MATVLKFVDEIDASPTTRLDLNSWTSTSGIKLLRGFSPGLPPKRTQVSESGLVDGGTFSSSVYGLRTLTIPLQLYGNTDTRAETVHDLAVELDRDSNLLMYQPDGATHPVFFKTLPSTMVADLLNEGRDINDITLEVQAQPFALGDRQTIISAQTVTNDPAAASNGLFVDLGTPLGDVPTPAYIWTDTAAARANTFVMETSPPGGVYFFQAEAGTNGTDTADQADADYSGGNGVRITFATNTDLVTRITHSFPTTMPPGTYRLFARLSVTAASTTVTLRPRYHSNTAALAGEGLNGDTTTWTTTTVNGVGNLVDLGLVQYPSGSVPVSLGESGVAPVADTPRISLMVGRTAGTGSLDVDYLVCVPAAGIGMACFGVPVTTACRSVFDGPNDAIYKMSGSGPFNAAAEVVTSSLSHQLHGSLPVLTPGVPNRLHWLGHMPASMANTFGVTLANQPITAAWDLSVSYWPRYLYVRPAAS